MAVSSAVQSPRFCSGGGLQNASRSDINPEYLAGIYEREREGEDRKSSGMEEVAVETVSLSQ